ncbi:N-6 DNA methylase [Pigmentibacter sp. JX0631]|uniref:class I SAM-dependent DNA methyltransferase n=1 Tax=Pigmentibacter sp. JX0631 TaxID=2976982 RepID=UPI0024687986|nr:DNA methyltransferase [Pigmentibacter sp. JX0631]WGL61267.1 N-6 DNA methylase [Pigmentibacter sp. JX0631]
MVSNNLDKQVQSQADKKFMQTQYTSIQDNLSKFYHRWKDYSKNERQGYQTFLTEFFNCFGIVFHNPNDLPFEVNTGNGFADAFIKDIVIIEMKDKNKFRTKADLLDQLPQALKYWEAKKKNVPYLILCNFHVFIIYDTRDSKNYSLKISELENNVESFYFLLKLNPTFIPEQEEVTKKSAQLMGQFYKSLRMRLKDQDEEVDLFVLQCLFCLFSEDIGYLPPQTFTNCVHRIKDGEDNSANILSTLFKMMDEKDLNRKKGRFQNVRYFNGPLFCIKPEIVLNDNEEELLWQSCQLDWKNVRPEIFGALFESSQTKKIRHNDGMHFTFEEDIMKVIKPCILDFWNELVSNCKSLADLREVHKKLKTYRILDPACGSGNFLVVAYRELKAIEAKIFMEYKQLSGETYEKVQEILEWFPITNMYGIEINPFSSFLTKVSLWISKKLIRNQYKLTEPDLPLEDLKHIISADALVVQWNDVDVVVGNPPYIGCKMIRKARGDKYFKWLGERFRDHNKMSDYCTYWFEKVFEDVRLGVRVGFVCTKTISQTNSRRASLDKVIESGGTIFNAISHQKWSGEAKVHVSIVNFLNKSNFIGKKVLNGKEVDIISSRLLAFQMNEEAKIISANLNKAFQGITTLGKAFIISDKEARSLLKVSKNKDVIKQFYTASSVVDDPQNKPSEWIIDFQNWPIEKVRQYPEVLKLLKKRIEDQKKTTRRNKTRNQSNEYWWQFWRSRPDLRAAISKIRRYILVSRHTKYPIFIFVDAKTALPEDSTVAIALQDYGSLGILQSKFHTDWYKYQCSTLGYSLRYTNTTVFQTFPFPERIDPKVGQYMEQIDETRKQICRSDNIGLTTLYNNMNEGSYDLLRKLHKKLDDSVADSYSFDRKCIHSQDLIIEFLISLNYELTKNTSKVS